MTLILTEAGASVVNEELLEDAPAVRLAAANITFTNTERGRIASTLNDYAAFVFEAGGGLLINQLGGTIASRGFETLAILGSSGDDRIDNAGLISGRVELGLGNDSFMHRTTGTSTSVLVADLGGGDDRFTLVSGDYSQYHFHRLNGGAGDDTLVLEGSIGVMYANLYGALTTGFEHLVVGADANNLIGLSNFQTVTLAPGSRGNNFLESANPNADLALAGTGVTIGPGSSFRNVTGSDEADHVQVSSAASGIGQLLGSASLGGGDDSFTLSAYWTGAQAPVVGGTVDGGAGLDSLLVAGNGSMTFDLANFIGFERIDGGGWTSATSTLRLTNVNGFAEVRGDGEGGTLTIAASTSPNAAVSVSSQGKLVLESTAIIGRYGFPTGPGWETGFDAVVQGDPQFSVSVVNNGTILGTVQLYYGDDLYDGRLGSTGGAIYGYAGNDRLYGGAAADVIDGGYGADDLFGEGGNDTLIGGGGGDRIDGGTGDDTMAGGTGDDSYVVDSQGDLVFESAISTGGIDRVTASVGHYLYANVENLVLAADAGGIFGVGNGLANAITGNGSANLLLGGSGNDSIAGGGGGDSLFGEAGDDGLSGDAGIDYLVGGAGNDTLDGGSDADAVYGEDGDDVLTGGAGFFTDILVGGLGNDVLNAASGLGDYDLMDGGAGDDVYRVDTPDDLTFEALGGGTDTVHADIVGAGYYLYANTENLVLEGATPFGVGNELANNLSGNAIGNYLLGGLGDDTLIGRGGNDVLFGEGGADLFVFDRGTGGDVIGDFAPGTDRISLQGLGISSFAQVQGLMVQVGGNSAINLGLGDFIVLNGVTNAQLTAADFLFG